ncbi:MAG: LacI family DNA-binding transcriptional regulator [bacterium]
MAVTLRDVASRCGLSPSTVSGVLNNRSSTWASAETRRRVEVAASELGYRPHSAARALRTGKTQVVAFIYHAAQPRQHTTFDGAAEIIAAALGEQGYGLKLHVYPDQKQVMKGLADLVSGQSCDAVALFGREADVAEQGTFLEENGMPFVVKGRHELEFPHWPQVDYDHEGMMHSAVRLLKGKGHTRIGYIGHDGYEFYQKCLYKGFCEAIVAEFGATPREDQILLRNRDQNDLPHRLEQWAAQWGDDAPTAAVIGTNSDDWYLLERLFALRGVSLGDRPGQFGIAGSAIYAPHLAYGCGHYFADVTYASIADIAVRELLLPVLAGDFPHPAVQRILPELRSTESRRLPLPAFPDVSP